MLLIGTFKEETEGMAGGGISGLSQAGGWERHLKHPGTKAALENTEGDKPWLVSASGAEPCKCEELESQLPATTAFPVKTIYRS